MGDAGQYMSAAKLFALFSGFVKGVNNVDDPLLLSQEELSSGVDIDLDDSGKPSRRKGKTLLLAGAYKWGWSDGSICLAWVANSLVSVKPDFSGHTVLMTGLSDMRVVYVKIRDKIYFSNGQQMAYVRNGVVYALSTASEPFKDVMPAGTMLEHYQNRLWSIRGNQAWPSDPLATDQRDTRVAPKSFPGPISLFMAVKDGVFVGTDNALYFMAITDPTEGTPGAVRRLADYGAVPHAAVKIEGGLVLKDKTISGTVIAFATKKGICIGSDGGEFQNLTIQRYELPAAAGGSAFFRKNHKGTAQVVLSLN